MKNWPTDFSQTDTVRVDASVYFGDDRSGQGGEGDSSEESTELKDAQSGEIALYYRPLGAPADGSKDVQLSQPKDATNYKYNETEPLYYKGESGVLPLGSEVVLVVKYSPNSSITNSLEETKTVTVRPDAPKLVGEQSGATKAVVEVVEGQEYAIVEGTGSLPEDAEWKSYLEPIVIDDLNPGTKLRVWTRAKEQEVQSGQSAQWVVSNPLEISTHQFQVSAASDQPLIYGEDYTYENGLLVVKSAKPIAISLQSGVESATDRISVESPKDVTANVTLDDVRTPGTLFKF